MPIPLVYVLSTRTLSPSLVEAAATKRVIIDTLPFIAVELLTPGTGELPAGPITAVFTSANAVAALEKEAGHGWKIFCLGHATQRQVAERFGQAAIAGTADSARELAEEIIRQGTERSDGPERGPHQWCGPKFDREVWFFCGDRRRDELPVLLKQAGLAVHECVVYRTRLTPQRIGWKYDAIAFFSPSAVESFFSVNTIPPDIPLFAIGGTTAGAIRRSCDNPVIVGERPDEEAFVHQIIKNIKH